MTVEDQAFRPLQNPEAAELDPAAGWASSYQWQVVEPVPVSAASAASAAAAAAGAELPVESEPAEEMEPASE